MLFLNQEHQQFYEECINKAGAQKDIYRQSLFYILGLTNETRKHIDGLYDFDERGICIKGLFAPWQTGTTIKVTRMAFNLYNGFAGDIHTNPADTPDYYTPEHLFSTGLAPYFVEGVKLRYPECFRRTPAYESD